jgi:hypothetical protein
MITRRGFLKLFKRSVLGGALLGGYAFIVEPSLMLRVQHHAFTPPGWTPGLKLRAVMLADPHVVDPHMPLNRWQYIVQRANELEPDLALLMGDYRARHRFRTGTVSLSDMAKATAGFRGKLGCFAILGNHDWWDDLEAQRRGAGPILTQRAFEDVGLPVLANGAVRLVKDGKPLWVTGTDSIVALRRSGGLVGLDDLPGTLARVTDDAPIVHLAHEPDLFVRMPERVSVTLCGHTHGGQVRIFGYSPVVPSMYGNRFAYGHIVEGGRHLVVSGGLGCSGLPVRFGIPPEITVVDLG